MPEGIIEQLERYLETEEHSEKLTLLSTDIYSKAAMYMQNLRRTASSNNSDVTNRLITKQVEMLDGMVRRLLNFRLEKALVQSATQQLLPEERYVCSVEMEFQRRKEAFLDAVTNGQPSFVGMAYRNEMGKSVTVRFLKPVTEIVGFDLRRYGPYKPQDLAVIPSANVDVLVANGEAVIIYSTDTV